MPRYKYVGPFDAIDVPALGVTVARGDLTPSTDLDLGPDFEAVSTAKKKES